MISREPTIERLAIGARLLLDALRPGRIAPEPGAGRDQGAPGRRRRPVLPVHPQRRLEPGRRHRQDRQLQHRPGRGRARGERREDRLRLFRRHLRGLAARRGAHRALDRRGRAQSGRVKVAQRARSPRSRSLYDGRRSRSPRSTAPPRWRCWRRSSSWPAPRTRASRRSWPAWPSEYDVVLVARADGTLAADVRPLVRLSVTVIAEQNGRARDGLGRRRRALRPGLFRRRARSREYVDEAVKAALTNLESRPAPAGEMTVVLGPGWPGILLHEAIGHGLEGDFNRKGSSAFCGPHRRARGGQGRHGARRRHHRRPPRLAQRRRRRQRQPAQRADRGRHPARATSRTR